MDANKPDLVNHPPHYKGTFEMWPVECIQVVENLNFVLGNAIKYVWRAGSKGNAISAQQDLDKALWYTERVPTLGSYQVGVSIAKAVMLTCKQPDELLDRYRYHAILLLLSFRFEEAKRTIRLMKGLFDAQVN